MTTNATVEARHKDEAAQPMNWLASTNAHAQTLANLEAARAENADLLSRNEALCNRLAEIDRIAVAESWAGRNAPAGQVAAIASGHTPSPCPGCAAKDEAMAAFKAEVSDAVVEFGKSSRFDVARTAESYHSHLSRFIIPPADPLAEELRTLIAEHGVEMSEAGFDAMLAWHKSRLEGAKWSRLGGAK